MNAKQMLRRQMLLQRNQLPLYQKNRYDQQFNDSLVRLVTQQNPKSVHVFLPMRGEPDIFKFIEWLLSHSIIVICPVTLPKRQLKHVILKDLQFLEKGLFGTQHPSQTIEFNNTPDMIIVPALAYDYHGFRLGYGGGYYDAFLSHCKGSYSVGLSYPFQYLETIPVEPHDYKVKQVIVAND